MTELTATSPGRAIDSGYGATLRSLQQRYEGQPIDVSFRELVGPLPADELTHSVYPYPARLLRQIPRMLFRCEQIVGDIDHIIDPFCGAGTVLVEAQRSGFSSSGIEQNPIGALASRVKTAWLDVAQFTAAASVVLDSAKRGRRRAATPAYLERWYSAEAHAALSRLTFAIENHPPGPVGDALALALALTARRVANTDRRIPVPVRPRDERHFKSADVWFTWSAEINRISKNLERLRPHSAQTHVVSGDSRQTSSWDQAGSGERALVFTSPPYGAAQKYIRSTSLELGWLGYSADRGTIALEKDSIGREHLGQEEIQRSREHVFSPLVEQAVSAARAVSSARGAIYATYFADMERVFNHVGQRSARIVLVSGTNTVGNLQLDTYALLGDMVQDHGFKRILSLRDEIRGRSFMTKRRSASDPARAEYIEIFERGE